HYLDLSQVGISKCAVAFPGLVRVRKPVSTTPSRIERLNPSDHPCQPPDVAVVIPAFRAAAHIKTVLAGIPSSVRHIVVVDECSPDSTAKLVQAWADPRLRLVVHDINQGVGGAVLSGYNAAVELGADIIVKM